MGLPSIPPPIRWPENCNKLPIPGHRFVILKSGKSPEGYLVCGGQGFVYEAESTDPTERNQRFAIKFPILRGTSKSAFLQEATLGMAIRCDTISATVAVLEAFESPCFVMTYHDKTLFDLITECRDANIAIPRDTLWTWTKNISDALKYLHQPTKTNPLAGGVLPNRSLVHRDIKPGNIMIDVDVLKYMMNRPEALLQSRAIVIDLGTVGEAGKVSSKTVFRKSHDDLYKSAEWYPLEELGVDAPPQTCHPAMDIYAFGAILNIFDQLDQGHWPW